VASTRTRPPPARAGGFSRSRASRPGRGEHLAATPLSWLNQIELYFSIVQRKALAPNDCRSLEELSQRLLGFQDRYAEIARPFEWTFTRSDLERVLTRITNRKPDQKLAAERTSG
jgi:hypothetical protein